MHKILFTLTVLVSSGVGLCAQTHDFEEVAPGLDYPVVHLLPAFRASSQRPLVFDHDPHWNAAGHALVAEVLASFVLERTSSGGDSSVRMPGTLREDES